jgi:hypothetical protein
VYSTRALILAVIELLNRAKSLLKLHRQPPRPRSKFGRHDASRADASIGILVCLPSRSAFVCHIC